MYPLSRGRKRGDGESEHDQRDQRYDHPVGTARALALFLFSLCPLRGGCGGRRIRLLHIRHGRISLGIIDRLLHDGHGLLHRLCLLYGLCRGLRLRCALRSGRFRRLCLFRLRRRQGLRLLGHGLRRGHRIAGLCAVHTVEFAVQNFEFPFQLRHFREQVEPLPLGDVRVLRRLRGRSGSHLRLVCAEVAFHLAQNTVEVLFEEITAVRAADFFVVRRFPAILTDLHDVISPFRS